MDREAAHRDTLRALVELTSRQRWDELATRARAAAAEFPDSAPIHAFVAHALRQLQDLAEGYRWAARAVELDPQNLFAVNRLSLLANLTGRFEEAYAVVGPVLERKVRGDDAQNLAVAIVNAIHAASRLDRIAEAVAELSPAIVRLDHPELHFNSACLYALAGDPRSYTYVAKSLAAGKPVRAFADSDFESVRGDPRFVELLARDWQAEAAALARSGKPTRDALQPEDFLDPAALRPGIADDEHHLELERAIDADVDDPAGYVVYADWFQGRGNPLGWIIPASGRCATAGTESARMLACVEWAALLHEHAGRLLGPFAGHLARTSHATWRHGFIRALVFDLGHHADDGVAGPLLAATLRLPACRFLRELSIGDVSYDGDYDGVVDALRDADLRGLQALSIAPNKCQLSSTRLDVSDLVARFPALESLVVGAGEITLGALDLPALRRFAIRTGGLRRANLAAILAARWPRLRDLEIWFGTSHYGADDFRAFDVASILVGRATPELRRLALRNAELTDELCAALVSAPILGRLEELDLSMGTLGEEGARTLIASAPRFAHLARLSIADNCVPEALLPRLREVLPNIELARQKQGRYVSVGE